jgi:hypothetical protein
MLCSIIHPDGTSTWAACSVYRSCSGTQTLLAVAWSLTHAIKVQVRDGLLVVPVALEHGHDVVKDGHLQASTACQRELVIMSGGIVCRFSSFVTVTVTLLQNGEEEGRR